MNKLEENKTIWGYGAVVDNEKLELTEYFILVKKTNMPVEEAADIIISRKLEKKADELGIKIESSSYLHGQYDWTLSFTAENIRQAKKFSEALNGIYHRYISDLILIEKIFPIKKCGIQNPSLKKLKEFV
jgi:DNA-binding Lrp family transcriptional regulator